MTGLRRLAVGAVVLALAGCVAPSTTTGAYVENGKAALDSAISATATAQQAVEQRIAGDAPRAFSDVVVTDSESAIAPIEASFGGVDPPTPADDALRDSVMTVLGDTSDALSDARIAVRRDDPDALRQAADGLATTLSGLQALRESLP